MKKICVVTATRAEYGYLKWLMEDIQKDSSFELQLVVSGTHLSQEHGNTVNQIIAGGLSIAQCVDVDLDNSSPQAICETMSRYSVGFTQAFSRLKPDLVIVLGDRYELLPICSTAFMLQIPIAHLSGGDVTEGALDDGIRNVVTMLATYHFPITEDCKKNVERMRGGGKNIFVTGSTSLDYFNRMTLLSREELANDLGLDVSKKWVLCTLHSETKQTVEYNVQMVKNLVAAMKESLSDYQILITKANADLGEREINTYMEKQQQELSNFFLVPSLGQHRYFSFMKQVSFVVGNSSSGITESPYLGIPTINIGDRQKGRYQCSNIVQANVDLNSIKNAFEEVLSGKYTLSSNYWGDGNATKKIVDVLKTLGK